MTEGILKKKTAERKMIPSVALVQGATAERRTAIAEIKTVIIPLIIRADSSGSLDGIHHELKR